MTDPVGEQRPSAERLIRGARAAQSLSEALWETLHDALAEHQTGRAAELCERLAEISQAVASLTSAEAQRQAPAAPPDEAARSRNPEPARTRRLGPEPAPARPPCPDTPRAPASERKRATTTAVIIDELAARDPSSASGPCRAEPRARASIEIRDERAHARSPDVERGFAPWVASVERSLERYRQDRRAFALLLLELADLHRLRHAEPPGEMAHLTGRVEAELSGQLRPADSLMRESPGRYWLLAPQTDGLGAQRLAARMTDAAGHAASHRGAPLRLAVGIAVCAQDPLSASELIARAEVGLYAAHASGRSLATGDEVDRATGGSV